VSIIDPRSKNTYFYSIGHKPLTRVQRRRVVARVVGTKSLSGKLFVDVGVGRVEGVVAAPRVEGVGAADQQPPVLRLGQDADVVLAVILEKNGDQCCNSIVFYNLIFYSLNFHN
jgi:hypothetical protein